MDDLERLKLCKAKHERAAAEYEIAQQALMEIGMTQDEAEKEIAKLDSDIRTLDKKIDALLLSALEILH
tara:strand:+ start:267 stop:473 length:207 start_codon:yes stop_codon:yes gene_type:complete